MSNFKGKRMVDEDLIKKLEDLEPGGGTEYTEGDGISIDDGVLSVDYGTGLTVDDGTLIVNSDNKTIVVNSDGKLETTVGGWEEVQSLGYGPKLIGTSSDWDLIDATLANTLYNMLDVNVQYPVTLEFINCAPTEEIVSAYIESSTKTETKFGGNQALHVTTSLGNEYDWQFYVDISNNNIHIWTGSGSSILEPVSGSNIIIDFGEESGLPEIIVTEYHKIDHNYLNYEFVMTSNYVELSNDDFNYIYNNKSIINILRGSKVYHYQYEDGGYVYFVSPINEPSLLFDNTNNSINITKVTLEKYNKLIYESSNAYSYLYTDNQTILRANDGNYSLKTAIGGGYYKRPEITLVIGTDTSATASNNKYTVTNQDFIDIITNAIVESYKNNENLSNLSYSYVITDNDGTHSYGMFFSYSVRVNGDIYFTTNSDEGINFEIEIDPSYNIISSNVSLYSYGYTAQSISIDLPSNVYFNTVETVDAKFIPIDGTTITVDGNGKLAAAGSLYTHHIILKSGNTEMATVNITSKQSSAFTISDLITFLYNQNITDALVSPYNVRILGTYQPSPKFDVALWTEGTQLLFGGTQTGSTAGADNIQDIVYEI